MSSEVDKFLAEHADFIALEATGKIRCTLTGHECKATIELLHEHVRGRKYAQALRDRAMTEKPIDLSRFDFIIQHKKLKNKVYCKLTKFVLNKNEQEIERHVSGKRFQILAAQRAERSAKRAEIAMKRNAKEEQAQLGGIWLPEGELAEEDDDDEFGDLSDDSDSDSNSEGGGTSDSDESDDDDGGDDDLGFEIVRRSKSKRSKAAELVDADEEDTSVSIASEDAKDASALTRVAESSGPLLQTMLAQSEPIAAKPKRKKATVQVAARNIASDDDDDDDFQFIQEMNQRAQQTLTSAAAATDGAEKKRKKAGQ